MERTREIASLFLDQKKMMTPDELYMQRCLDLAKMALGNAYPNPLVGSVIVHNNQIIGEGFHAMAGEPHAEINAINSVKNPELLRESTLYVNLEPCSHFGRTPPCANTLAEIGFRKVVIGSVDQNEKVNGTGISILKNAGIEVVTDILQEECLQINKRFFTYHSQKRPFILLKWAETEDGFMDDHFKTTAISNSLVNQYTHQIRSQEHSILVGTSTVLNDNPQLTTRNIDGRNPIRIALDFDLKIPSNYKIFDESASTIIINSKKEEKTGNLTFLQVDKQNFIPNLLQKLHEQQIQSVLVEGGRHTLQQFIDSNLWDEALVIRNPDMKAGHGTAAPTWAVQPVTEIQIRNNQVAFYKNQ